MQEPEPTETPHHGKPSQTKQGTALMTVICHHLVGKFRHTIEMIIRPSRLCNLHRYTLTTDAHGTPGLRASVSVSAKQTHLQGQPPRGGSGWSWTKPLNKDRLTTAYSIQYLSLTPTGIFLVFVALRFLVTAAVLRNPAV